MTELHPVAQCFAIVAIAACVLAFFWFAASVMTSDANDDEHDDQ